ncbi:hypothetical protein [Allokutzneria albata]|uniref:Gp37 protein n=1 Tax=Allokutzneria albata TaxID=211114 RepID=A0A1H0DUF2_ALLAB|nr:hypothetical protein [Allokutzneria albata]SDN73814.1 hypothetical protein SAMN04489726_8002 [Allokutzneria albata]
MTHTRAVAVKTALYQRLSAAPELAGVDVAYSWDGSDVERERIYLGRITSTSTLAIFGGSPRIKRDEQLSVTLYIVVRIPGGTVAETDARADELAAAVEELLTVDPGLSGVQGLSYATVAGHELEYLLDDDGCTSVLAYRITCSSRLR